MAPLTGYRRWFEASTQMRANAWMLMTGSLGMVASTLPVQWLMPVVGWRALFLGMGLLVLGAMALIAWKVPPWATAPLASDESVPINVSYAEVWRHPYFRKMAPVGFFCYGGLVAMQTLWVSPWMIHVVGYTPAEAANGLFWVNVTMLLTFWLWGMASPWLARRGLNAEVLIARGLPFSFVMLAIIIGAGQAQPISSIALWAIYCIACTFVSLAQPAVGMAFPSALAGRALSAYNLLIFAGVFTVQWGVGLSIEGFKRLGLGHIQAYQAAMAVFLACCIASYLHFLNAKSHNLSTERGPT
jgi:predicted MFS family arabinose efflux permease